MSFVKVRRAAAIGTAVVLGACGDSTAPTIDYIDAGTASARVTPVINVMEQEALASFALAADIGGLPASASSAALTTVARLTSTAAQGKWDRNAPLLSRAAARADVIPVDARGRLYTYNQGSGQYEGAASDAAPANGIRIVLYAMDVLATEPTPSLPLTAIGYVDLIDQSTTGQNRLVVQLVRNSDGLELLDYAITHTLSTSSESFSIVGEATNGTTAVTFDLSGTASETAATATFELNAPSVGFSVEESVNVNALTGQASVTVRLGYDGHTLSFGVTLQENSMSGEVRYDGYRYATFSMTYDPETGEGTASFTKANGQPLTAEELEAITGVFENALDFDDFWSGLLWPIGALAPAV